MLHLTNSCTYKRASKNNGVVKECQYIAKKKPHSKGSDKRNPKGGLLLSINVLVIEFDVISLKVLFPFFFKTFHIFININFCWHMEQVFLSQWFPETFPYHAIHPCQENR